jgi:glucose-6-phosphate isomerase
MIENRLLFEQEVHQDDIDGVYDAIFAERDSQDVGYYELPVTNEVDAIKAYSRELDLDKIKNIAVLGIGGSSLGTKAIDELLKHTESRNDKKIIYFENVDPNEIVENFKGLVYDETLFIVISKSGGTIETTSHLKFILHTFDIELDSEAFKNQFVFITDENSPLDKFGKDFGVKRFYIPSNVGGRFSVFSPVGLLPLHLLGYDIAKLLEGANSLKESFFAKKEETLCKKALFYATNKEEYVTNVLFSYASAFKYFNDWYVQLWGESLGKVDIDGSRVGLTPIGIIGSVDQHSFLQLIIEGPMDKSVTMIKVKNFGSDIKVPDISLPYLDKVNFINNHSFEELINAQCDATMESIKDQNVPVDMIEIEKLDESSVGYMVFYYELLTSMVGSLLHVNTYEQPGVELGKVILKKKFEV